MHIDTRCIHAGYKPGNGEPRVVPIVQSTTYRYDNAADIGAIFDLEQAGFFYTRLGNPTVDALEQRVTALEGGVAAIAVSSGQAATTMAILGLCNAGDHVVCCSAVYGGTYNVLDVTLRNLGIDTTFVPADADESTLEAAVRPNTKCLFGETLSNPSLCVIDIEMYARIANKHNIPLVLDNTFATPIHCRPFEHGAHIVTHSTSKYMDGHGVALGGIIVDSGNYDWGNGKFPQFSAPDASYHGVAFAERFGKAAYIAKCRLVQLRDMGAAAAPMNAFLTNLGLETLPLRMARHSESAEILARWLSDHDMIESVNYPRLPNSQYYQNAQKYLPNGCSGVISFCIKGGRDAALKLMQLVKLISICTHVSDLRTYMLHPAGTTHRQHSDETLQNLGIPANMIRLSVGLENVNDIIEDIQQALHAIQ